MPKGKYLQYKIQVKSSPLPSARQVCKCVYILQFVWVSLETTHLQFMLSLKDLKGTI